MYFSLKKAGAFEKDDFDMIKISALIKCDHATSVFPSKCICGQHVDFEKETKSVTEEKKKKKRKRKRKKRWE